MKKNCYALLLCLLSITAFAEPFVGEFAAEMPGWSALKNPTPEDQRMREMYLMTAQRIEITADKLVLHMGQLTSQELTYTREGNFLLGKAAKPGGEVMFYPFYIADPKKIYGEGFRLVRTK